MRCLLGSAPVRSDAVAAGVAEREPTRRRIQRIPEDPRLVDPLLLAHRRCPFVEGQLVQREIRGNRQAFHICREALLLWAWRGEA